MTPCWRLTTFGVQMKRVINPVADLVADKGVMSETPTVESYRKDIKNDSITYNWT